MRRNLSVDGKDGTCAWTNKANLRFSLPTLSHDTHLEWNRFHWTFQDGRIRCHSIGLNKRTIVAQGRDRLSSRTFIHHRLGGIVETGVGIHHPDRSGVIVLQCTSNGVRFQRVCRSVLRFALPTALLNANEQTDQTSHHAQTENRT